MNYPKVRLGEVCELIYGDGLKEQSRHGGNVPVYGSNGIVGYHSKALTTGETIIIGRKGSIGEVHISRVPCWPIDTTYYIENTKIPCDFTWLYYILIALDLTRFNKSAAVPGLNRDDAYEQFIPLPPLDEQRRIAALLQRADRLRRLRRFSRQLSDTFLQSVFLQMFGDPVTNPMGWEIMPAGDVFEIQLGKMRSEREITGDYLHPYLRNVNVQWGYLDLSDVKEMDFLPQEMGKYLLRKGDILVCEGGEVGRTAVYNGEIKNCAYQNALHRLRAKAPNIINTNYFINFMRAACDSGLIAKFSSQVTIAHFTAEKFVDLGVMVPPMSTQEEYSQICDKHKIMSIRQLESSRQSEQLFQTLLARAFS